MGKKIAATVSSVLEVALKKYDVKGGVFVESAEINPNTTSFSYEEMYRLALDKYPGSVIIIDRMGRILYCNEQSEAMLGAKKEWLLTTDMKTIIKAGLASDSAGLKALETKTGLMCYISNRRGEGMLLSAVPVLNKRNEAEIAISYSQDEAYLNHYLSWMKAEKNRVISAMNYVSKNDLQYSALIAISQNMRQIIDMALRVAPTSGIVTIYGESGVGKEVLARFIHENSKCANGVFLAVNCAAIPHELVESEFFGYSKGAFTGALKDGKQGLFELADGGTIFLDEIGDLPLPTQGKLLRVLENGEIRRIGDSKAIKVDARIICATNRNLRKMVEENTFREDLFYRLNVLPLTVPPLRQRVDDIAPLTLNFLAEFNRKNSFHKTISPETLDALERYSWPGNVRELRNVIERLVIISSEDIIELEQLQLDILPAVKEQSPASQKQKIQPGMPLNQAMRQFERQYILETIEGCGGNLKDTAKKLDIHISGLYKKLNQYEIDLKKQ